MNGWSAEERIPELLVVVFRSEEGLGEIFFGLERKTKTKEVKESQISGLC